MKPTYLNRIVSVATAVLAIILVLLPFHAFLTVWAADHVGNYTLLRVWKEILLILLIPLAVFVVWKVPRLWRRLEVGWLFWAIIFYALLHVALGLLAMAKNQVNGYALAQAMLLNLRFFLIFLLTLVFATQSEWLKIHWRQVLLWPAVVVVGFGLLQFFVLPADFLKHFGYGTGTITPYTTVDQKLDYVRIQSTLRGANPLGAYLSLIVIGLAVALLRRRLVLGKRVTGLLFLGGSITVLAATYSRSAYIGLAVALLILLWEVAHRARMRRWLAMGLVVVAVIGSGTFLVLQDNDRFQNTFFHTNEDSMALESSNESRSTAMLDGLKDVVSEPFGRGPGTAGPASAHNVEPARIAENYYLQIGQEVGWLGLILFAIINSAVGRRLWRRRGDPLARTLFASLVGISVINLMSHAWADDTLSLLWWALAGVALAPAILPTEKVQNGKQTQTGDKPPKTLLAA